MARRHVTVVLSGDGGDELFGGYDRYVPHPRVAAFDRLPLPAKRRLASTVWPLLPTGRAARISSVTCSRRERPASRRRLVLPPGRKASIARARCCRRARQHGGGTARASASTGSPRSHRRSHDARRLRDLPAGGYPDESGPDEHGALDRIARAASRQRGHRLRRVAAVRHEDPRGPPEARSETRRRRFAAAVDRRPPEAGIRRADWRLVPRRADSALS